MDRLALEIGGVTEARESGPPAALTCFGQLEVFLAHQCAPQLVFPGLRDIRGPLIVSGIASTVSSQAS